MRMANFLQLCLLLALTCGCCRASSLGKTFVTAFLQNDKSDVLKTHTLSLYFNTYSPMTTVSVWIGNVQYYKSQIQEISTSSIKVTIPPNTELSGVSVSSNVILIKSDKDISVMSMNSKALGSDTTMVYPLEDLDTVYYIVTPSEVGGLGILTWSSGGSKAFAVVSSEATTLTIYLKGAVNYKGVRYGPQKDLTVSLSAYTAIQILSDDDLTGSRVVAQKPVAVLSGHTCIGRILLCNHIYEQLTPVSSWGKNFIVTPTTKTSRDIAYVVASQVTKIQYSSDTGSKNLQTSTLNAGGFLKIDVLERKPVYIMASAGIEVLFYGTGLAGLTGQLFMAVPPVSSYCYSYSVSSVSTYLNFAVIIAITSDAPKLQLNIGKPLDLTWSKMPGTDYSWATKELSLQQSVITSPSPFLLLSFGFSLKTISSYGSCGICKDVQKVSTTTAPPKPTCNNVKCRAREKCRMVKGQPICVPLAEANCYTVGDPHYKTFDGRVYGFQGTCTYTIAKSCGVDSGLADFSVEAKNENRGNSKVSYVSNVTVKISTAQQNSQDIVINVVRNDIGFVKVNNKRQRLPLILNDAIQVFQSGNFLNIVTDFSLKVLYDWNSMLYIYISSSYFQNVCGMCGNYNENLSDDFAMPSGTQAPSTSEFGKSWKVDDGDSSCWNDCNGECKPCPPDLEKNYLDDKICGLISAESGPFQNCYTIVSPKVFVDNCVYDVCLNGGSKKILCESLATYATICQRNDVIIGDWRALAGCPLQCPANSQYKLCGTTCNPTCNDAAIKPSSRFGPCLETCQCNEGYALDGGKCIPKANCGCIFEGKYYAPNEIFWGDDKCEKQCVCNTKSRKVDCKITKCMSNEICTVVNGIQDCYPKFYGTCTASTDPHFVTFDGVDYDFQGTCVYLLAGLCNNTEGLVDFQVYIQNENRANRLVSYPSEVRVTIYDLSVIISRRHPGKIRVNGLLINLPFAVDKGIDRVSIYRASSNALLQTRFGLKVSFNWDSRVTITVPGTYAGLLCGLCGNFNGEKKNEFVMKNGQIASSPAIFGQSWNVQTIIGCTEDDNPICPNIKELEQEYRSSKSGCGLLLDKSGPFRDCHAVVDPEVSFNDCVFDVCFYKHQQDVLCKAIASYVLSCQEAGACVYPWRSDTFCSPTCASNSSYDICASGCSSTCFTLSPPLDCKPTCSEGCVCNDDFILSGDDCIPIAQCGCTYEDVYYKPGEKFLNQFCTQQCRCTENGVVSCEPFSCGPYEKCKVREGVRKCQPIGSAQCSIFGGSHYLSFDGLAFDLHGNCTYVLVQANTSNPKLTPFVIIVKNEKLGNSLVAVTKLVVISVYGYIVFLQQDMNDKIKVNGLWHNLPLTLENGKISAYQHGNKVIVDTDFGLRLSFDLVYSLTVKVPGNYKAQLNGLCGNYNGDKTDDYQLPDKTVAPEMVSFAVYWKVPIPGEDCDDGCGKPENKCPVCDNKKQDNFKSNYYCGFLKSSPALSPCFPVISPDCYFNNCVVDMCSSLGDLRILCQNIQSYVSACQVAGVDIQEWRTNTFCPLDCPLNSKYSLCSDVIVTHCAKISDPGKLPSFCSEGCSCNYNFFDGKSCVPIDKCGCFKNGEYYKLKEKVLSRNCSQVCTCNSTGILVCEKTSCDPNETCQIINGYETCISKEPPKPTCSSVTCRARETCQMVNEQPICVPLYEANCYAVGEPHYMTFDGLAYDVQGTCTYTIAKTCGNDSGLSNFSIEAKNENRGNTKVSYISNVTVKISYPQENIIINVVRNDIGFIKVNNKRQRLPLILNGTIQIFQSGNFLSIVTDFNLKVLYDWNSILYLYISSSYFQNMCGMCGNYNEDPSDDFATPSGTQALSLVDFAKSWKVDDGDSSCWNDCNGECKPCPPDLEKNFLNDNKCGFISAVSGPFKQCYPMIDPKTFVDYCVYDVCLNGGSKKILCESLATYAIVCQLNNVTIGDWRALAGCPLQCPANSQYKLCGSACNPTCNDDAIKQSSRSGPCLETCQCNEGYALDGGKCIPKFSCGCIFEGKYYAPNEIFWGDDKCEKQCVCNPKSRKVECKITKCKPTETCMVLNGIQDCYPNFYGTCTASTDPHYVTFDGVDYDFQGTCVYLLAGLCNNTGDLVDFQVYIQNENRANRLVSYPSEVRVTIYDLSVIISRRYPGKIRVNGLLINLPFAVDKGIDRVSIYQSSSNALLQTRFGLKVSFNWDSRVAVNVPGTYAGLLCGLCGSFNGDLENEFVMKNGQIASSPAIFGQSWKVQTIIGCTEDDNPICPNIKDLEQEYSSSKLGCGLLIDKSGPFRDCHAVVDPEVSFNDCVFDVCFYKDQQDVLCKAIASYVLSCQEDGAPVYPWRSDTFCSPTCASNSSYDICASGCSSTCFTFSPPLDCKPTCSEGCVCNDGFILSGDDCIPIAQCGCTYEDIYYKPGEKFLNQFCTQQCRCTEDGVVSCEPFSCGPYEKCKVREGVRKCQPIGSAQCSIFGGSHYLSFDGLAFDLHGNCTYVLVQANTSNPKLTPFVIIVKNEKLRNSLVAVTKLVVVSVYGYIVFLQQDMNDKIKVNGLWHNLPLTLENGKISAYQHGNKVIVDTDFGLQLSYDLVYSLTVKVPGNYKEQLNGLCGNYNGDKTDDYQLPDKTVAPEMVSFAVYWKVPIPGEDCDDGCGKPENKCPVCDNKRQDNFKSNYYCGFLKSSPALSPCFPVISPDCYFNNCVVDMCSSLGDLRILCQNIQSYVSACQMAGVDIQEWRTNTFCPLECPLNSKYSLCSDVIVTHCAKISDPDKVPSFCSEGCSCNYNFFDGKSCVPIDKCGCFKNGEYYKLKEKVLSGNCSQVCICNSTGILVCEKTSCDPNETCQIINGYEICVSKEPPKPTCSSVTCRARETCQMVNEQPICVPLYEANCYAVGEPHYKTFDGLGYDVQGTCTYTIAKTCGNDSGLSNFSIEAKNENRGNTKVSYVSNVTVKISYPQDNIIINVVRNDIGFVKVNNKRQRLPLILNGTIQIFQSGNFLSIVTDFSLKVLYDWNSVLYVYISSSYFQNICGMCGNYNEDPSDDFATPSGTQALSLVDFANSWKVDDGDSSCWNDCNGECKPCPPDLEKNFLDDNKCGLISAVSGPFKQCYPMIDPKTFVAYCVYDVCLNGGSKKILCESLATYAIVCQLNNVTIGDWRALAGCPLQCPANSQYKLCGSACNPTCNDAAINPSSHSGPCLETCQCNEGYALDGGKCIPKTNCGCIFEGKYYAPNEIFWGDDKCEKQCVCNPKSRRVDCKITKCKPTETCMVLNGIQDCYPNFYGTCTASTDPHFVTFDGVNYDFQGTCVYLLAGLCNNTGDLVDFQVYIQNENRANRLVSYPSEVRVTIYDLSVVISRRYPGKIWVNGLLINLPFAVDKGIDRVSIYQASSNALLQTRFGLKVSFNWDSRVAVNVPGTYAGLLCGLCGSFNGDTKNEFVMKSGQVTSSPAIFGKSWNVQSIPGCTEVDNPICPKINDLKKKYRRSKSGCGLLIDKSGPFRDCHAVVDPEVSFNDCLFDVCFYSERQDVLCKAIASYVLSCQEAGARVYPWRSDTFCSPKCGSNSSYSICASGCSPTCFTLYSPLDCKPTCSEGCVCNDGFILSGDECIPIAQCGCTYEDVYYKPGEKFLNQFCTQQCKCMENGMVSCKPFSCGPYEECKVGEGVRKCQPIGSAQCSVFGGSHYLSFDGLAFDFLGTCTYVLVQANTTNPNLTPFVITVKNEKLGKSLVAVTKLVTVSVYGYIVFLQQDMGDRIKVNDLWHNLPLTLENGKISAYQHGNKVIVDTDFGLRLSYDLVYSLTVKVPGNYKEQLNGLCGDYNGNKSDDYQLPDKTVVKAKDFVSFAVSWKVAIPEEDCDDVCGKPGNKCPVCYIKTDVFKSNFYCGFIKSSPALRLCFPVISPDRYFNNCVVDMCFGLGDLRILCRIIQSYVSACQVAGVVIQEWRTNTSCPFNCPPNGQYSLCSNVVTSHCAKIADPGQLPSYCSEGCSCNDDYFYDGKSCVPMKKCGCFENGEYYKQGEKVLSRDCNEVCTCHPSGILLCKKTSCRKDEICRIMNGVVACVSSDPCKSFNCKIQETCKVRNGYPVCEPNFHGTCLVLGDPHFITFDGFAFDFQGTCTYTLIKYDGESHGLIPFTVEERNENRGSQTVSFVRNVNVYVYGYKISIVRGEYGKIRINDVIVNLPITLLNGKISASISIFGALVRTDFGLSVIHDYNWHVMVKLSSSYFGLTKGLCGNFNQNPEDEMVTVNNTIVSSIVDWAKSWKVNDSNPFCYDICPEENCPTCDDGQKKLYRDDKQCGLIINAIDGPFRECHPKIKPDIFYYNCLYDTCIYKGAKPILCQALAAYNQVCRDTGVKIYDWRTPSGCGVPCPDNSHYEACGSACPATCIDRTAPSNCSYNCVETCACNDRFVLSVDKCVPELNCGFSFNDTYYPPNEEFWLDENCSKLCKSDPAMGMVVCTESSCKASEQCMLVNGVRSCQPISYSTCLAMGHPHFITFDGLQYDFMGTCVYQLVGVNSSDPALPSFAVQIENNNRGNPSGSNVKVITLLVYNALWTFSRNFPLQLLVNGVAYSLPFTYQGDKIIAYISGNTGVIKTNFGVSVTFDWNTNAAVTVPNAYFDCLNGLCGNNNNNPKDDFILKNGESTSDPVQFANSWKVVDTPGCTSECTVNCTQCTESQKQNYSGERYCGLITKLNGPFANCFPVIDPTSFFADCIYDACQYRGHPSSFCSAISAYVASCQAAYVKLADWRSETFCPPSCPENSHYELCGDGCPVTCQGLSPPPGCEFACKEGCYCNNGFLLSGHACTLVSQCGCVYQGRYLQQYETFYSNDKCTEKCVCTEGGIVKCSEDSCSSSEKCKVVNGILGCFAKDYGTCVASGDPHYISFDGLVYDFQGMCSYIFAKTVMNNPRLVPFTVIVQNEHYRNLKVSVTKKVLISVYNYSVEMDTDQMWKVKVDGEVIKLPLSLLNGKIVINQEGSNIVLQTDFGLKLLYDTVYHVTLQLPYSYIVVMGGLCGNFNGDPKDDFQLPNTRIAKRVKDFGEAWKVDISHKKCVGCEEVECPIVVAKNRKPYMTTSSCGMITDPKGPFQPCHALINAVQYLNFCTYDASLGKDNILCKSLQAYTSVCNSAGVTISGWRTSSFCPMECPENSHYEQCAKTNENTCYILSAEIRHSDTCYEGCVCDTGYLYDGGRCVSMDKCGCVFNGRYLADGESYVNQNCTQRCTCQYGGVLCTPKSCNIHELCQIRYGVRNCYTTQSDCQIKANTFVTFDGALGGPVPLGPIVVASIRNMDSDNWYRIVADVQNCGTNVSAVARIHVYSSNGIVTITRRKEVWVNGHLTPLPAKVSNMITISLQAGSIIGQITKYLRVELNDNAELKVTITEGISEDIAGACGNFNGQIEDDFLTPDGKTASDILHLLISWRGRDLYDC